MKNKSTKTRLLVLITIVIAFIALGRFALARCPEAPNQGTSEYAMRIYYLYPWPEAKIPFMCQTWAFLKSPFGPDMTYSNEEVLKEDGYPILDGYPRLGGIHREGVIAVRIAYVYETYTPFQENVQDVKVGTMPAFAKAVSIYVDGKKLKIGYVGYIGLGSQFVFATIRDPFLWPGEHVGKVVVLLPSGETMEYEWQFEITWW